MPNILFTDNQVEFPGNLPTQDRHILCLLSPLFFSTAQRIIGERERREDAVVDRAGEVGSILMYSFLSSPIDRLELPEDVRGILSMA